MIAKTFTPEKGAKPFVIMTTRIRGTASPLDLCLVTARRGVDAPAAAGLG